MDSPSVEEHSFVREVRERWQSEGKLFWLKEDELGIFDAVTAQRVNAANYENLTMPDRLVDVIRRKSSKPVSWQQLRAAWTSRLGTLANSEGIRQLALRMAARFDAEVSRRQDLPWLIQNVCSQALVPFVVAGLDGRAERAILRDQQYKLLRLTSLKLPPNWSELRSMARQVGAGLVVRRELRGRARGHRPRRNDLADPIVDMLPDLGMDRAMHAVTAVFTAIAGPPGAAAGCLLYELTRQHEWRARLEAELASIPPDELYKSPARSAPVTTRFVKETLRVWSPPLFLTRPVRTDLQVDGVSLRKGQRYLLSPYLVHHNAGYWSDPELFDPDRWLPDRSRGPCPHASYVAFGWAPTSCIGAGLGLAQLILLAHLMCTRYRIELAEPERVRMALAAIAIPQSFVGNIVPRH